MISTRSGPDLAKSVRYPPRIDGQELDEVNERMKTILGLSLVTVALFVLVAPASATSTSTNVGFGHLYFNDNVVRTVVPPAAFPNEGRDNFYKITNGVTSQLGIASVAPGSPGYHGGDWKVFHVAFKAEVIPTLLKSEAVVLAAQAQGQVTITRVSIEDFRCPIQP